MAVVTDTIGETLERTTNLVAASSAYTCLFWFKAQPKTGGTTGRAPWVFRDNDYSNWIGIYSLDANINDLFIDIGIASASVASSTPVAVQEDGWTAIAYTRSGTTHTLYLNGASASTATQDVSALTLTRLQLCGDDTAGSTVDSNIQYFREWNSALTLAQIIAEHNSTTPIVTSGLQTNTPLVTNYEDTTAGNNDWTPIDSPTFIQGPVPYAATNTSGAAAHDLADILDGPGALQVMKTSAGASNTFFWTYTPADQQVVSVFGFGDVNIYKPVQRIYLDAAATLIYRNSVFRPLYAPLEASTDYWYRFAPNANPARGALWIRAETFSQTATPPGGSIIVNDASDGWPVAILDGDTGDPIGYRHPFPGGENMAQLNDGTMLVQDETATNSQIWSSQFVLGATIPNNVATISSNRTDTFYTSLGTALNEFNASGVSVASYTLDVSAGAQAPERSGPYVYYAAGSSGAPVKRWNRVTNTTAGNWVAGETGYVVYEIFVLRDESVLLLYRLAGSPFTTFVKRYNESAVLQNTYAAQFADNDGSDPHLAINFGDTADSFWGWYKTANDTSVFKLIQTSDGTVLDSIEVPWFQLGENGQPLDPNMVMFGASESCTFIISQNPSPEPPVPGEDYHFETHTPRRLRRCPFVWKNAKWLFVSQIQVLFESGVGLSSGQGEHPAIMCRWSKDGGHTWSNLHDMSLGDMGHYAFRTMLRRLGRGRDWLFEITATDPVKLNGMGLLLDVEEGTS